MEKAFSTIESLVGSLYNLIFYYNKIKFHLFYFIFIVQLKEGEELCKIGKEKAQMELINGEPKAKISYSHLCERINGLGSSLAQIKSEFSQLIQEKIVNTYIYFNNTNIF